MRKNLFQPTVVALALPICLALATAQEPLSIPEHVKQLQREVESLVLESGKSYFMSDSPDPCGTKNDPCKIVFDRRFWEVPHCVVTAWNPDGSPYEENVVIDDVAVDHMTIWSGNKTEGTSIIVSWICVQQKRD